MKKVLCIALCLMFVMSNITTAFGLENDYENNWAKNEIEYMKNRGIISGYPDGSFKPSNNMSKAEFYKVINKIMGFAQISEITFNDVVADNWYYNDVAKGVAAGYIIPAESLEAGKNINRGEVARIIGIVFSIDGDKQEANNFTDSDTIPEQLKAAIGGLKKNGYINGYPDGSFRVNAEITRAEVVKMLCNITGEIINEQCTVNSNAEKNLVVNTADVTLKDMEIGRNLYLTEGIGEGDVFLENVKVKSSTIVNGGGANSVNIKNSEIKSLLLDKKQNLLNVVLSNSKIETTKNANQARLQLNQGSSIKNLELKDKAELVLEKNALIERLIIIGAEVSVNAQGSVNYLKSDAKFKVNGQQANANTEYKIVDGKLMLLNPPPISSDTGYTPPPAPVVNKTALAAAIALAEGKIENDYTSESWATFAQALQTAKAINSKANATQTEVNTALASLNTAMAGLKVKEPVQETIENLVPNEDVTLWAGKTLNVSFNGPEGGSAYFRLIQSIIPQSINSEVLIEVQMTEELPGYYTGVWTVTGSAISTVDLELEVNLTKVDGQIISKIADAIIHIVDAPSVDKSLLEEAIALAEEKVEDEYTPESWAIFAQALLDAIEINEEEEATQEDVNIALENLTIAMNALVKKVVGPEPTIVAKYQPSFIDKFPFIYVEVENLQNAIKFSVVYYIYGEDNVPKLTESNIYNINEKSGMIYYNPSEFEAITIKIYDQDKNLLHTFEDVIPTLYGETPPATDKTALVEMIALAEEKIEDNYTAESWAIFAEALQAAIAVNNNVNATQNEVNTKIDILNNAMANLVLKSVGPAPTIVATLYSSFLPTFGNIGINEITNLSNAAKYKVEYYLSPNDDGSENLTQTKIVTITEKTKDLVFYNPKSTNHKTIKIMIYDSNDVLIYTFDDVVPVIPK